MQILFYEKEGDEKMARKRFYLAFLLILGLLVFAACARYDVMPDRNLRDNVLDNNNMRNDGGLNGGGGINGGGGLDGGGGLNGNDSNQNNTGNNWNTNPNTGPNSGLGNNNLNR